MNASFLIFEITQPGFSWLFEALGYDRRSIAELDAFQPFEGMVRFGCRPPRFETVQTMNMLELLKGSDPYLGEEVIILGTQ